MGSPALDPAALRRLVTDAVLGPDFRRATFGGAARAAGPRPWLRVVVRPVELRGQRHLQFSYFDATKDVTKNYRGAEAAARLAEVLDVGFAAVHLSTGAEEVDIRVTRKGKAFVGRRPADRAAPDLAHDRSKDVPLPEGPANRVLDALGLLTHDGRVRPALRAKYTQINEFLRHLTHVIDEAGLRALGRPVRVLDCGCGSSHLTLAAHHFLNDVLGVPAQVTGVDLNGEVVCQGAGRAERLGADAAIVRGPIAEAGPAPDLVLALHACDTATDDALARAVAAGAAGVLCVPCCHRHLNGQIRPAGPAAVLRPLLRHGLLRQRTADLVTDAVRALALRVLGYRAEVVEFVSPEHTARNLLIRAVRGAAEGAEAFAREYVELRRFWGVTPYLEGALGDPFRRLLPDVP